MMSEGTKTVLCALCFIGFAVFFWALSCDPQTAKLWFATGRR